jgi:hypothetical protein
MYLSIRLNVDLLLCWLNSSAILELRFFLLSTFSAVDMSMQAPMLSLVSTCTYALLLIIAQERAVDKRTPRLPLLADAPLLSQESISHGIPGWIIGK